MVNINRIIADELKVGESQVAAAVALLDEGATVPFIARYRKEATGGLDDTHLRHLHERLGYLRELEERRAVILRSIAEQGKLSPELQAQIQSADSKTRLEDLYLPYRPKRRTKGQIAREAGLEPLADALLADPALSPEETAAAYVNIEAGVADIKAALEGARYILMERFAEDAALLGKVRDHLWQHGHLKSSVVAGKEREGAKYSDYFSHSEPLKKVPSHRALAMLRGRNEGILQLVMDADPGLEQVTESSGERLVAEHIGFRHRGRAGDDFLRQTVQWTWKVKVLMHLESELLSTIREQAEAEAIGVFARNLKDLLMAAPAGPKATLGLDPGLRTGCKVAAVDATGKLLETTTIYPHEPHNQWDKAVRTLAALVQKYQIELIAIGNGTASRETDKLAGDVLKAVGDKVTKVMVSEAGASVYSASEVAALEFPGVDVSLRGAVSIARRLQDPLAELVKIEPKSIGVGQYQHDVSQVQLARSLDAVIEDCVNTVGVDINTASIPLLTRVSGLNKTLASNIVALRDSQGRFANRRQLLDVSRLGPKAFEQCAGFLRIANGDNPLDATCVHPEAYPVVERIIKDVQSNVQELMGNGGKLRSINPARYTDERFGEPTVRDILKELEKPGRDPRPEFKTAEFKEGVEKVSDLAPGMILEGVVTNVANFGAFVDIGVHQDGLVHISALSDKYVADPREVVKAGDIVKVKVLEVDLQRQRVALTMRLSDTPPPAKNGADSGKRPAAEQRGNQQRSQQPQNPPPLANAAMGNALAAAFANAKRK
ncbi:MAG: RNA-binding transcriptional accessory protein [Gammaproteobacteria bacterium]|nr:RNA-binding transcriptional accessory protein [Gammaproteobacteria bacterium]